MQRSNEGIARKEIFCSEKMMSEDIVGFTEHNNKFTERINK
jgi:hypothetical protein